MEEAVRILSLIIVFGQPTVEGFDPCTNNANLANQESRCPSVLMSGYGLCDRFIAETWYRVDDGADIPTSCPGPLQCNTQYAVWMNGTMPAVGDGVVQRVTCVSSIQGCCSMSWTIRVKNCGSFRVYYLKPTDYCPSAYCLEKRTYSTTTLDSSEESSASSSSQDVTSTSTENSESVTQDVLTSDETDRNKLLSPMSPSSHFSTTTNTQTDAFKTPVAVEVDKTPSTGSPDITQSQVIKEDSPDVLKYVLVAVVGFLCLIIAIILVLWISKRNGTVIRRKGSKNKQETTKPSNYYSDLPDSETIYYSIDQDKETENNAENERRASAQDRNMYLDAIQHPVLSEEFRYDEAKEVEEINDLNKGLENKEMYLKMGSNNTELYLDMASERRDMYQEFNRKSLQASSRNNATERTADTGTNPYECPGKGEENHEYASLPNGNTGCSNAAYETEQYDKIEDSGEENGNRLSSVSYDDVNFNVL